MNFTLENDPSFLPGHFHIYDFYGESTFFGWYRQKLAVFPFATRSASSAKIFSAPDEIRQVQCYSGRIFIICTPQGVYKLSKDGGFAVLSKSAIGISTLFYQVFTPRNQYLYLENKKDRINKQLFRLTSSHSGSNELCVLLLDPKNTDKELMETINGYEFPGQDACIIAYQKRVFKLVKGTVYLMYKNIYPISELVPILSDSNIKGLMIMSNNNSHVIAYSNGSKLVFETIYLGTKVEAVCSGFSHQVPKALWIVYSEDDKLFYARKQLSMDGLHKIMIQDKGAVCLRCYDSKRIIGLTRTRQLLELSVEETESTFSLKDEAFTKLHKDMLQSTTIIANTIFNKAQELEKANRNFLVIEERLKRISLYAQKRNIQMCPEISLGCLFKETFLTARFRDAFPLNCWIVFSVRSKYSTSFCSKKVISSDIALQLQVPTITVANDIKINVDLVTLSCAGKPWCLMRNCVNETIQEKKKKKQKLNAEKKSVVNAKLAILRKLAENRQIDMKKLSDIKRSVRKELGEG